MLPLNGPASYLTLPSSKISMAQCPPLAGVSALPSTTVTAIGCRVQTLPTAFFSAKPELWLSVPKLSRSCIPRGWDGLLTQSTWPSCGLSSGHNPPPCWLLLQSCGNALETAGQQQCPDWHGQAWLFRFIGRTEMRFACFDTCIFQVSNTSLFSFWPSPCPQLFWFYFMLFLKYFIPKYIEL